jgi:hypothetical protein
VETIECRRRSFVKVALLEDTKLRPPEEVIKEHDGKCPFCGKELIFNPDKIEINIL